MSTRHHRLNELMQARRLELGMKTWRALATEAGISYETLRALRSGENITSGSAHSLEGALQWEPGSIDLILDGGDPTPRGETASPREKLRREVSALEAELEALLAERQGRPLTDAQRRVTITWAQGLETAIDALDEEAG